MSSTVFQTSSVVIHAERPVSSMMRAREFAHKLKLRTRQAPEPIVSLDGELVVFRNHIAGLDERLSDAWERAVDRSQEPLVGDIVNWSRACTGHLYDVRDDLSK